MRILKHRIAITGWLPPDERLKESKGKRGWEVDAHSAKLHGGRVIRCLTSLITKSKNFVVSCFFIEGTKAVDLSHYRPRKLAYTLYQPLLKKTLILRREPLHTSFLNRKVCSYYVTITDNKINNYALGDPSVLVDLAMHRKLEVKLAACLWYYNFLIWFISSELILSSFPSIVNVIRSLPPHASLSGTDPIGQKHKDKLAQLRDMVILILNSAISNEYGLLANRTKACHILSTTIFFLHYHVLLMTVFRCIPFR